MKILNIPNVVLPDVLIALGRRAAYYDNMIQHAKSFNSECKLEWTLQSKALWDLLKQLGVENGSRQESSCL